MKGLNFKKLEVITFLRGCRRKERKGKEKKQPKNRWLVVQNLKRNTNVVLESRRAYERKGPKEEKNLSGIEGYLEDRVLIKEKKQVAFLVDVFYLWIFEHEFWFDVESGAWSFNLLFFVGVLRGERERK